MQIKHVRLETFLSNFAKNMKNCACFSCFEFKTPNFAKVLKNVAQICVCTSATFRNSEKKYMLNNVYALHFTTNSILGCFVVISKTQNVIYGNDNNLKLELCQCVASFLRRFPMFVFVSSHRTLSNKIKLSKRVVVLFI